MTQTVQTLTNIGMPRRRIVIGRAWDTVTAMHLSPVFKRSLLGPESDNGRPSSRPDFLRIYFAMRAKNFPISPASLKAAEEQRQQRMLARKRRQEEHAAKHRMPANLCAEQREAWIAARKNGRHLRLAAE